MKPTIKEIKQVAIDCGLGDSVPMLYTQELKVFVEYYMKLTEEKAILAARIDEMEFAYRETGFAVFDQRIETLKEKLGALNCAAAIRNQGE